MMFLFVVKCADNSYYVGVSNDLDRRISEHNMGVDKNSYTYSRRPVRLVFSEVFENPEDAIVMEKRIKGWSRAKKEALFRRDWGEVSRLSKGKK